MPRSHLRAKPPRKSHDFTKWNGTWLPRGSYGVYVAMTGLRGCYGGHIGGVTTLWMLWCGNPLVWESLWGITSLFWSWIHYKVVVWITLLRVDSTIWEWIPLILRVDTTRKGWILCGKSRKKGPSVFPRKGVPRDREDANVPPKSTGGGGGGCAAPLRESLTAWWLMFKCEESMSWILRHGSKAIPGKIMTGRLQTDVTF